MAENARASPTCDPRGYMFKYAGPGKINLIKKFKKNINGIPDSN